MASTFTPNINIEEPARGDDVGTWDTPVNNNGTLLDLVVGGAVTIGLNNAPVVLATAQFQSRQITFNSTLTGSVIITFPSTFKKDYIVRHTCTGSSAFVITLQTTVAGGQAICCRPGNPFQCYNDGTNLSFVNLGTEIGGYWDYAGSSLPAWVSGCTVPPYLNCDGTTFSAATYPQLSVVIGSTTLPDMRGRVRGYLNQGTGRLQSSLSGVDGNTNFAAGGGQTVTLSSLHLPQLGSLTHSHVSRFSLTSLSGAGAQAIFGASPPDNLDITSDTALSGVTYGSSVQTFFSVAQPTAVGGLTLIRAA